MADMSDHGTRSRYTNDGCRCEECRKANTVYQLRRRRERVVEDQAMHGRLSTYQNYMCRCRACKDANAAHSRSRRLREAIA